ncbi:MAG: STAS domain-containing protein [Nitrospirota bacterium]
MKFKVDNSKERRLLTVEGMLTAQHAPEFKAILIEALKEANSIELNLEKVTEVDIACLQLICAAHKTSVKIKKSLNILENCSDIFKRGVKAAGYARKRGCININGDNKCLLVVALSKL